MDANGIIAAIYDETLQALRISPEYGPTGRELACAESAALQTGITTVVDLTDLTLSFSVESRPVYVEVLTAYTFVLTSSSTAGIQITDAANVVKRASGQLFAANAGAPLRVVERIAANTGAVVRKARILRTAGSGTISNGVDATYVSFIRAIEA